MSPAAAPAPPSPPPERLARMWEPCPCRQVDALFALAADQPQGGGGGGERAARAGAPSVRPARPALPPPGGAGVRLARPTACTAGRSGEARAGQSTFAAPAVAPTCRTKLATKDVPIGQRPSEYMHTITAGKRHAHWALLHMCWAAEPGGQAAIKSQSTMSASAARHPKQ